MTDPLIEIAEQYAERIRVPDIDEVEALARAYIAGKSHIKADTQRLDWLEHEDTQLWEICRAGNPREPSKGWHIDWQDRGSAASGETLRAAIDTARSQE